MIFYLLFLSFPAFPKIELVMLDFLVNVQKLASPSHYIQTAVAP